MSFNKIILTEDQKRAVNMPTGKPILIKGVAGSGKSTVALYRASKLLKPDQVEENMSLALDDSPSINGAIFTFNKQLVSYLEAQIRVQELEQNITLTNYHKWAYHEAVKEFLNIQSLETNKTLKVVTGKHQTGMIEKAIEQTKVEMISSVLDKPISFFHDEISWIKGQNIESLKTYLTTKRTGRGSSTRLDENNRACVWQVFEYYELAKSEVGVDFDDFALLVKERQSSGRLNGIYDFLIVDEVQDLTKTQIETLINSVREINGERAITFVGDVAQRIYKSNFTWTSVGIEIRGRSRELRDNYRNTREIYQAAQKLVKGLQTEEDTAIRYMPRSGRAPFVRGFDTESEEFCFVMKCIKRIFEGNSDVSIAILAHSRRMVGQFQEFCSQHYKFFELSKQQYSNIQILTMHASKGLEFDVVFLVGVNQDYYQQQEAYEENEEVEEEVILKRKLLYVAMTRAKQDLMITYTGEITSLLSFLEQ